MVTETSTTSSADAAAQPWRDVPIDWEALEDAFENNAAEVHSYLHIPTGDVLRIVDGVADPQMHARIAADPTYLRVEPVSSREQYRWMERYIPMVEEPELQEKLARAIDGKGAFRRFKDVLMTYAADRERWFAFRSERLRIFMEAWLNNHTLNPIKRSTWTPDATAATGEAAPPTVPGMAPQSQPGEPLARRSRNGDALRRRIRDVIDVLGPRELDQLTAFAEFLQARRAFARAAAMGEPPATHADSVFGLEEGNFGFDKGHDNDVSNTDDDADPTAPDTAPDTATPSSAKISRRNAAATS